MTDGERGADRWRPTPLGPVVREQDQTPRRSWFDDDITDSPADVAGDLVNLGFIRAALRRSRRVWVSLALLGLVLGAALSATGSQLPEASTKLLLAVGPESQPNMAIQNDEFLARTRGVAERAASKLHLATDAETFLTSYRVGVLSDQVLVITASAPSSAEAMRRSATIASVFLEYRAEQLGEEKRLYFAKLDDSLVQSRQNVQALDASISRVSAQPRSDSQQAQLTQLQASRDRASNALIVLNQQVNFAKASSTQSLAQMVAQSRELDTLSAPAKSRWKPLILFSVAGLVLGLVMGAGIVVVRALASDRLRRRDDVALALGAPVSLSIAGRSARGRRLRQRGLDAAQTPEIRRIVAFLQGTGSAGSRRGALAVVPVDETAVAALSIVSLASTLAKLDTRVLLADLCRGRPAATLLGMSEPGVHKVQVAGTELTVAIPETESIAPLGPFRPTTSTDRDAITAAGAQADVLLTLTTLDPSLPSDYLRTWAEDAVVVVTAGRSSWTKIHAVGELIRIAGTRLVSAVLIGSDKWDESLGVNVTPTTSPDPLTVSEGGNSATLGPEAPLPRVCDR